MNRLPVGCSTCAHKTIPTECAPCSECALSRPGGSAQVYWEGDAGYISQVKIKRLSAYARIPFHGTPGAAGYDLYAASVWYDRSEQILKIGSGLAFEIPSGYVGLLFPVPPFTVRGCTWPFLSELSTRTIAGRSAGISIFQEPKDALMKLGIVLPN